MELNRIEELLEKYFEGRTTVMEESILRAYFVKENIPEHLKNYQPIFRYFTQEKQECFDKELPLKSRKKLFVKWATVAAIGILFFGMYFGWNYHQQRKAEYAYQEAKKALSILAFNLGRGTEKVVYLKTFETTKQKIYNNN